MKAGGSLLLGAMAWAAMLCGGAGAIILHPGYEPRANWQNKPDNEVVGAWSTNASFCVIAPQWIVTTRHQNSFPEKVFIGSTWYYCVYSPKWVGGPEGNSDIQLVRLKNSDWSEPYLNYVPAYEGTDETDKEMVAGGWGVGWGGNVPDGWGRPCGYVWGASNKALRWCTNKIEWSGSGSGSGYTSAVIKADFDGIIEGTGYTQFEGICAMYDSGGGWFIKVDNEWKLAGVTRSVEHFQDSQGNRYNFFADPNSPIGEQWPLDPNYMAVQKMDSVRVSTYAEWITSVINENCGGIEGDLNGGCGVDLQDFAQLAQNWSKSGCGSANNYCSGADINRDTYVNFIDVYYMCLNWLAVQ